MIRIDLFGPVFLGSNNWYGEKVMRQKLGSKINPSLYSAKETIRDGCRILVRWGQDKKQFFSFWKRNWKLRAKKGN